jgi:hypothetical protein
MVKEGLVGAAIGTGVEFTDDPPQPARAAIAKRRTGNAVPEMRSMKISKAKVPCVLPVVSRVETNKNSLNTSKNREFL